MQTWRNIIELYMQLYFFSSIIFLNHIHLHPVDFTKIYTHSSKLFFIYIKIRTLSISFGVKSQKYNYVFVNISCIYIYITLFIIFLQNNQK